MRVKRRNEAGWRRDFAQSGKAIELILIKDMTTNGVKVALWRFWLHHLRTE